MTLHAAPAEGGPAPRTRDLAWGIVRAACGAPSSST
jgi:hypothetical protein